VECWPIKVTPDEDEDILLEAGILLVMDEAA